MSIALIGAESTMEFGWHGHPIDAGYADAVSFRPGLSWQTIIAPYTGLSATSLGRLPVAAFNVEVQDAVGPLGSLFGHLAYVESC